MILIVTLRINDLSLDLSIVVGALAMFTMPLLVYTMRVHFRSIDMVQQQAKQFSLQHCASTCCQKRHPGNSLCDRIIILRCISAWFGSIEDFEHYVQTKVQAALTYHLGNKVRAYSFETRPSATPVYQGLQNAGRSQPKALSPNLSPTHRVLNPKTLNFNF